MLPALVKDHSPREASCLLCGISEPRKYIFPLRVLPALVRELMPCEISGALLRTPASLQERWSPSLENFTSASIFQTLQHSQLIVVFTRHHKDFDNLLMYLT